MHGTRNTVIYAWDAVSDDIENTGKPWSNSDVKRLEVFWKNGLEIRTIASILNRTENAIYNKVWSLGKGQT